MNFPRFQSHTVKQSNIAYDEGLKKHMLSVYNYMFLGLAITGVTAFLVGSNPALLNIVHNTPLRFVIMFAPLVVVIMLSFKVHKMSFSATQMTFWAFAFLMGLSLSYIFALYTGTSIARSFFITASMFGSMSIYGYTTKKDLTSMGSFLIMGLFGIIILGIINIFTQSSALANMISLAAIAIFVGLTAYDTQKIKEIYFQLAGQSSEIVKKTGIMGALSLYLDFINIFIHLLHLIGDRK